MSVPARKAKSGSGPVLWPVILVIVGVVFLLNNFLLLGDFNVFALLPLLLVVAGVQILLRGDLLPGVEGRAFGITRGSVESGTIEVSSGGIDVRVGGLHRSGGLVAGQFAAHTRPRLQVRDTHTLLSFHRADTPWWDWAAWHIEVAGDLPWQFLVRAHLGQINLDLSALIVHEAAASTWFGDITLSAPPEAFHALRLRSRFGNIYVTTPPGYHTCIIVEGGRLFRVHADIYRYHTPEPNVFVATEVADDAPLVTIYLHGTFGDAYLT